MRKSLRKSDSEWDCVRQVLPFAEWDWVKDHNCIMVRGRGLELMLYVDRENRKWYVSHDGRCYWNSYCGWTMIGSYGVDGVPRESGHVVGFVDDGGYGDEGCDDDA